MNTREAGRIIGRKTRAAILAAQRGEITGAERNRRMEAARAEYIAAVGTTKDKTWYAAAVQQSTIPHDNTQPAPTWTVADESRYQALLDDHAKHMHRRATDPRPTEWTTDPATGLVTAWVAADNFIC